MTKKQYVTAYAVHDKYRGNWTKHAADLSGGVVSLPTTDATSPPPTASASTVPPVRVRNAACLLIGGRSGVVEVVRPVYKCLHVSSQLHVRPPALMTFRPPPTLSRCRARPARCLTLAGTCTSRPRPIPLSQLTSPRASSSCSRPLFLSCITALRCVGETYPPAS